MRGIAACVCAVAAVAALDAGQVIFRAGVDLVTLGVTITDKSGGLVTDLTRDDFQVVEDGASQRLEYFASGAGEEAIAALHPGLMLDTSASMERDLRLARSAAIKFLNLLPRSEDITLVDFDTEVRVTRYPQRDFPRVVERIRNRKPEGWTALYDALGVYLDGAAGQQGRPVLVMYTDGADSRSSLSLRETVELLKASHATVYAVGLVENAGSARMESQQRLRLLAETTGGQAFFPTQPEGPGPYLRAGAERDSGAVSARLPLDQPHRRRPLAQGRGEGEATGPEGAGPQGLFRPVPTVPLTSPLTRKARGLVVPWGFPPATRMPSVHDRFTLTSDFELRGDQVHAVPELVDGLNRGDKHQVLLGVTGSGKTYSMAQVIARVNRPTLVMAHNKTLAAQLFQEFRRFFTGNAVEYFVSYYDYYQPEAYVPSSDTYIEKESTINDEIDRMRLSATRSLFERRDVIIVASVSCIYGLGSPEAYYGMLLPLETRPAHRP